MQQEQILKALVDQGINRLKDLTFTRISFGSIVMTPTESGTCALSNGIDFTVFMHMCVKPAVTEEEYKLICDLHDVAMRHGRQNLDKTKVEQVLQIFTKWARTGTSLAVLSYYLSCHPKDLYTPNEKDVGLPDACKRIINTEGLNSSHIFNEPITRKVITDLIQCASGDIEIVDSPELSEMVEWCVDYLLIKEEHVNVRYETQIDIRIPSIYQFVLEFLAQKLGLEKELVRDGGYDYMLLYLLEEHDIIEYGQSVRCSWYNANDYYDQDKKISDEHRKEIKEWIEKSEKHN